MGTTMMTEGAISGETGFHGGSGSLWPHFRAGLLEMEAQQGSHREGYSVVNWASAPRLSGSRAGFQIPLRPALSLGQPRLRARMLPWGHREGGRAMGEGLGRLRPLWAGGPLPTALALLSRSWHSRTPFPESRPGEGKHDLSMISRCGEKSGTRPCAHTSSPGRKGPVRVNTLRLSHGSRTTSCTCSTRRPSSHPHTLPEILRTNKSSCTVWAQELQRRWRRGLSPDGTERAQQPRPGSPRSPLLHSCLRAEATGTGRERVYRETRLPLPGMSPQSLGVFKPSLQAGRRRGVCPSPRPPRGWELGHQPSTPRLGHLGHPARQHSPRGQQLPFRMLYRHGAI